MYDHLSTLLASTLALPPFTNAPKVHTTTSHTEAGGDNAGVDDGEAGVNRIRCAGAGSSHACATTAPFSLGQAEGG